MHRLVLTSDTRELSNVKTIETGLSDFHAMFATVLRGSFHKKGPKIVTYQDYHRFVDFTFREKVTEEFNSNPLTMQDFSFFNSIIKCILDKEATLKKKYLRANDGPFMTRELRKAIMKRSRLKNIFNKCEQMKTGQLTRSREISV